MDIEKLIEQLKYYGTTYAIGDNLGKEIDGSDELMLNAATALSTMKKYCDSVCGHLNEAEELNRKVQAENEKLRAELEQVKQERDEVVECINTVYSYILIKSKTDAVRTIEKWLRGQKED